MTLENKYNRGTHGDSSHMLSTVVLSNENQTCRGWEAPTSIGGGGCHCDKLLLFTEYTGSVFVIKNIYQHLYKKSI